MAGGLRGGAPRVVANMATFPARAATLEAAIARLAVQVDQLNVCLNEFVQVPDFFRHYPNARPFLPARDLKDIGKFAPATEAEDLVLLVDDDLPYPGDYVRRTVERFRALPSSRVVAGYHGTIYTRPGPKAYLRLLLHARRLGRPPVAASRRTFGYWRGLEAPIVVEQLGTGTVILPGALMPPLEAMLGGERRADIRLARWCFEQGVPMIALDREDGWLPEATGEESIYQTYTRRLPEEASEEISRFAFRVPGAGLGPGGAA